MNAAALRDGAEDPALAARLRGGTDLQRLDRGKLRDGSRLFPSLREAIAAAATDPDPAAGVAWILTSGGHILRAVDIETLWLDRKAAEASERAEPRRS